MNFSRALVGLAALDRPYYAARPWVALLAGLLLIPQISPLVAREPAGNKTPDVVYVPTPHDVVLKMLELAGVKKGDVIYDLGCGDGRIVVMAAKRYGCRGSGFEIEPERLRESARQREEEQRGEAGYDPPGRHLHRGLDSGQRGHTLLAAGIERKVDSATGKTQARARIVSHDFDMRGVKPDKVIHLTSEEDDVEHTLYLWTVRNRPEPPLQRE